MNSRLRTVLIWLAGGALLAAMIVDTLAMIGRQIGDFLTEGKIVNAVNQV